jgi:hypothetical protein
MIKKPYIHLALALALAVLCASLSFAQEMPAPGTTIDKSNYKKYAHLFPAEYLPMFEDGFGGIFTPLKVTVATTPQNFQMPKAFEAMSAKNKGKFGIDKDGYITGGFDWNGFPFPDLQRNDPNFLQKLMWNYDNRYLFDSVENKVGPTVTKRRGGTVQFSSAHNMMVNFAGRIVQSPKPVMETPIKARSVTIFYILYPEAVKDMNTLGYRYLDPTKSDDTYLYIPALRRVLRAESGQRSVPLQGSTQALDDFSGFNGRIQSFTYKLVGEQKVLGCLNSELENRMLNAGLTKAPSLLHATKGYEVRDCYVIDIFAKDTKYPQGRKRIWLDKTLLNIYYSIAWDKAGKVWKVWDVTYMPFDLPGGDRFCFTRNMLGIDIQFGLGGNFAQDADGMNKFDFTWKDLSPSALMKAGR